MPQKAASRRVGRESEANAGGEPATKRAKLAKAEGASEEDGESDVWRNFVLWLRETGFRWDDKVSVGFLTVLASRCRGRQVLDVHGVTDAPS